ncbi:hypothetical protein EDB83DRAFT_2533549 [Lactarius deliciosus]|nr:hypothetical protein EDB83DRAFT_2533549 [Lactarius deliciosus]
MSDPSHSHPSPTRRGVDYILNCFQNIDNDVDKPGLMTELLDILNSPAPLTEGLSPLHWLGLNPLVILGAPSGPPPPPDPSLQAVIARIDSMQNTLVGVLNPFTRNLRAISTDSFDSLVCIEHHLASLPTPPAQASIPSLPPSSTPVAAPAQDVEMARPPGPPPTSVPVTPTPAPVSKPRAGKPYAQPPTPALPKPKPAPAPTPAPTPRPKPTSFASVAKTPARPSLVVSLHPSVAGGPKPLAVRRSPQEVVSHLNAVLASEGHQVTLSAARWTVKNNLVVTAGPDTTAHHLTSASHLISDSLVTYLSADNSPLPVQTWENCKWARLLINGIPTGASLTRDPYSPSELHTALLADNPAYRGLRLTQPPSWVRAPTSYKLGSVSSLVLTFEDPLGDSLRSLLAEWTLFAFGHSGELKRWKAKPRNTGQAAPAASSSPP